MITELKELYQIAKEALLAWTKGGFKTKTGKEKWWIEYNRKERMNELVRELKNELKAKR